MSYNPELLKLLAQDEAALPEADLLDQMAWAAGLNNAEELVQAFCDDLLVTAAAGSQTDQDNAGLWYVKRFGSAIYHFRSYIHAEGYGPRAILQMLTDPAVFGLVYEDYALGGVVQDEEACKKILREISVKG